LIQGYGFLAVFAAGVALRRVERKTSGEQMPGNVVLEGSESELHEIATASDRAPAYLAQTVLSFNEQLERLAEVALVLLLGAMLRWEHFSASGLGFAILLLVAVRPLAVALGLVRADRSRSQHALISWFGVRGVGSLYYLTFAITHGLPAALVEQLTAVTLMAVALSIVCHGISVTPLMKRYERTAH